MDTNSTDTVRFWRGVGLTVFLAVAAFFLITEHRAHLYGAIPYALVLLCLVALSLMLRSDHKPPGGKGKPKGI